MTDETRRCGSCEGLAVLRSDTTRYRRGNRVVSVPTQFWECSDQCQGPDGERPFQFVDADLMEANDAAARAAWRRRFGAEMPPAGRPGRKTDQPRRKRVPVLMSDEEVRLLDHARGGMSRGAFLRHAMRRAAAADELPNR